MVVDCVSADQSDFTKVIRFNYIHSFTVVVVIFVTAQGTAYTFSELNSVTFSY